MRNHHSKKLISSVLAATLAGFFAISIMPAVACSSDSCVRSSGSICLEPDGSPMLGYKNVVGIDGITAEQLVEPMQRYQHGNCSKTRTSFSKNRGSSGTP